MTGDGAHDPGAGGAPLRLGVLGPLTVVATSGPVVPRGRMRVLLAWLTLFGTDYPTLDGTPIRDYVHVVDLAEAHRLALEATAPGDPRTATHLVCNLGGGRGFSVREVLDAAEQVLGRPVPHAIGDRREGDPPSLVAAIERARDALGWSPRRSSLEEMIGSASAWRSSRAGSG